MTLRVISPVSDENGLSTGFAISQTCPDNWLIRAIKLLPGESMALFGIGSAVLTNYEVQSVGLIAGFGGLCMLLTALIRYSATRNVLSGRVQWRSICIAVFTVFLWILALELPNFLPPEMQFLPGAIAIAWILVVPVFYKGNAS
ncbi:MAG: hypothetical protein NXH72_08775 [Hyphomonadaceae bacterium]|nr:hypothetical protein [Hyphomonadaceae bacterium]